MNAFPRAFRRLLLPALALAAAAAAPAQTIITTLPYTITQAGSYRLGGSLSNPSRTEVAITIQAPNVELDLGGYTLNSTITTNTQAALDIAAVSNVTIRNGTVLGGIYGIYFRPGAASSNHLVENVRVVGSQFAGIGFTSAAPGSVVRNNIVLDIRGSSFSVYGIIASGGVFLLDNTISKVTPGSGSSSYGIFSQNGDLIIGNTINDCTVGISGGKYLNNLTSGCTTPFTGGVNATGNN